jgi:hypothetical protein
MRCKIATADRLTLDFLILPGAWRRHLKMFFQSRFPLFPNFQLLQLDLADAIFFSVDFIITLSLLHFVSLLN